ncbi:Jjj2p Ecym_8093 [Eremothecium cymbalariae DBVPG|uniref:J domain-containing protein n=1 Tax=Eremothecium cymbalariae (strain CBS 270.75 / DBVPG 7215 / KCTC 17166 / NRRL Y-17582) TaxID=931890 RepID=G8JX13_ERECY|nr:Hypothetical protein Ecym_8093 [Eremothecium cymbalariae DBVPG\
MVTDEIKLDETTYYSVLGLPFDTTEMHIRKSYMRLARELHPDKSKSKEAAELFKIVAHAHSILTDKEKKLKYDKTLISKGLHTYIPKGGIIESLESPNRVHSKSKKSSSLSSKSKTPKAAKPYEEQPYGFGTEFELENDSRLSTTPSDKTHSMSGGHKSFNLKSYQHQRNPESPVNDTKKCSTFSARFIYPSNAERLKDSRDTNLLNDEYPVKMPKKDMLESPGSPFPSSSHRHYARTKFEARRRGKRSTSPLKTVPTSRTDSLDGLRTIINKFSDQVKVNGCHSPDIPPEKKDGIGTPEEQSDLEPDYTKIAENNETEPNMQEYIGIDSFASKSSEEEMDFKLGELNNSLPEERETFNMRNVSDSLDRMNVKRQKLSKASSMPPENIILQMQPTIITDDPANLSQPVNKPIPRLYKLDVIPPGEFGMDLSISNIQLPPIPTLQCNILDKSEIEICKKQILAFNNEATRVKRKLLFILSNRSVADELLKDRLIRVENMAAYIESRNYDIEVVSKLIEIQHRQRIVAESFTNLLRSVYATGTFS